MATKTGMTLSAAVKSYLGYLVGTEKSPHTQRNYRMDLHAFLAFLGPKVKTLSALTPKHLDAFSDHLIQKGYRTNTRRRQLLTVQSFLAYHERRKKLPHVRSWRTVTPLKNERIPEVLEQPEFERRLGAYRLSTPGRTPAQIVSRNSVLARLLFETGLRVSEITALRLDSLSRTGARTQLSLTKDRTFILSETLSSELSRYLMASAAHSGKSGALFVGYDRSMPAGCAMTDRAVELVIKECVGVTPGILRHSAAVEMIRQGVDRETLQTRLGLTTDYSIKRYEPWFRAKSKTETTSARRPRRSVPGNPPAPDRSK